MKKILRKCKAIIKLAFFKESFLYQIRRQAIDDYIRTMQESCIYRIDTNILSWYIGYLKAQYNTPLYLLSDVDITGGGEMAKTISS